MYDIGALLIQKFVQMKQSPAVTLLVKDVNMCDVKTAVDIPALSVLTYHFFACLMLGPTSKGDCMTLYIIFMTSQPSSLYGENLFG